jgi:phage terminase large subunit GpA-like protein
MTFLTPAADVVWPSFARGLQPDPNLMVDAWADQYMIIPKESGANEAGKYRTSRTPHARAVMQALSDAHPCKTVALMGASQMLKTQVGLNWFCSTVHQSPANFLWILPTGKLAKRTSARVSKTIAAVPEVRERVAAPRSRDSVNTLDTKEYIGGSLHIVTAGAAANLSEIPARRVLFDEVDRAESNVNGEGDPVALAKARQTTFERNRKSYFPSSPTITGQSIIENLYLQGTRQEALADCVHCGHAQPLVFERLQQDEAGQAIYPCIECGAVMCETDKSRMFARGAWSEGVPGDGETVSFTINAMFAPYGWLPWSALLREYRAAKTKLDEGSEELMVTFYNTRLARCWERKKEQTKASELAARAEPYKLGTVPKGGLILTAATDTQPDRLETKVIAWGEGMEARVVDYQVFFGSPAETDVWDRLDQLLLARYKHAGGRMLPISAAFIDSGGANTHDVYNFTRTRQHRHIYAIKGASTMNKPILSAKPSLVDVNWMGKTVAHGAKLWMIGTDTAKDYLAARYHLTSGPGAIHFSAELPPEYYEQVTAEYCIAVYKRGRKVRVWDKKKNDRNEAGDLMVYNLACAHYLGLHKKTASQWQAVREFVDPDTRDLFQEPPAPSASQESAAPQASSPAPSPTAQPRQDPWQAQKPQSTTTRQRRPAGRQW